MPGVFLLLFKEREESVGSSSRVHVSLVNIGVYLVITTVYDVLEPIEFIEHFEYRVGIARSTRFGILTFGDQIVKMIFD